MNYITLLISTFFVVFAIGKHLITSPEDTSEYEVDNRYNITWNNRVFFIGPKAGQMTDEARTGRYLCNRLSEVVNCTCESLPRVRSLQVECPTGNEYSRLEWFANKHRLQLTRETYIEMYSLQDVRTDDEVFLESVSEESTRKPTSLAWHVDSLDGTMDYALNVSSDGDGVHVFVVDTGFTNWYARSEEFPDGVQLAPADEHWHPGADEHDAFFDCQGHGTQVAYLIGGKSRSPAPNVIVHIVRIMKCPGCTEPANCNGAVSYSSWTFKAMDWIIELVKSKAIKKAIVCRSFSSPSPDNSTYNTYTASAQALADNDILWVASAGNSGSTRCAVDYCVDKDPDSCPKRNVSNERIYDDLALIVGATGRDGIKQGFSNWGHCVQQFMYGSSVLGVPKPSLEKPWQIGTADFDTTYISGTSFAAPIAAGIASLILSVSDAIISSDQLREATIATQVIQGTVPEDHNATTFRTFYDLDSIPTLTYKPTENPPTDDPDLYYYCAPISEEKNVQFSSCFYKERDDCIESSAFCSWESVPATTCRARETYEDSPYVVLCKSIPNACTLFSSFICVDDAVN